MCLGRYSMCPQDFSSAHLLTFEEKTAGLAEQLVEKVSSAYAWEELPEIVGTIFAFFVRQFLIKQCRDKDWGVMYCF